MTQVQGGEKGCVEGAQESLESETILSHSARNCDVDMCVCK